MNTIFLQLPADRTGIPGGVPLADVLASPVEAAEGADFNAIVIEANLWMLAVTGDMADRCHA